MIRRLVRPGQQDRVICNSVIQSAVNNRQIFRRIYPVPDPVEDIGELFISVLTVVEIQLGIMYQLRIVFEQIRIEKERRLVPVPEFGFPLVGHDRR